MNKTLLVGAGVTLSLLYLSMRSAQASQEPEAEATELAPKQIVNLLVDARYEPVHFENKDFNGILAMSGVMDGDPTAYDWVKVEQAAGNSVIVSKDIRTSIKVGSVILSLSDEAAAVFLRDLKTYYKIPVLP